MASIWPRQALRNVSTSALLVGIDHFLGLKSFDGAASVVRVEFGHPYPGLVVDPLGYSELAVVQDADELGVYNGREVTETALADVAELDRRAGLGCLDLA
jgi:hypothetical protein